SPDGGVYIQMRGIEQVRVRRPCERRHRPRAVAFIAALNVREYFGFVGGNPLRRKLPRAAAGALLCARGDENLHVRIGRDHRRDVAPIEHRAGRTLGERALIVEERGAHLGHHGDDRGGLADRVALQRRLVEPVWIERTGRRTRAGAVVERRAVIEQGLGDRAVEEAGVEVTQSEMRGETLAERPLAGRRRPVDRDDHLSVPRRGGMKRARDRHDKSPPSERISSTNPGKLVAMKAASSTVTGCSLASPSTSAHIALRWAIWVATTPPPRARPFPWPM